MVLNNMNECNKCQQYGLQFKRNYEPVDFLEGKKNSLVWIVGLNPAKTQDWVDLRTQSELEQSFDDLNNIANYFKKFKFSSELVFNNFGKEFGTAHTDIVKCSSLQFPPESALKNAPEIIANCNVYLKEQISTYKPKIIVCNGAPVSNFMKEFLRPPSTFSNSETSYLSHIGDHQVCVVLSGFIGRIDHYAKRRLGIEIESRLRELT